MVLGSKSGHAIARTKYMGRGSVTLAFWMLAIFGVVTPIARGSEGSDHLDRVYHCAFDRMVQRYSSPPGETVEQMADRIIKKVKEQEKLPPEPPPVDPARDPELGTSFRAMGIRGAFNPEELIASLHTEGDRKKVRDAYEGGKINLNQLLELQLICTLTDKPVQEMLDQYARDGRNYGPSSLTAIPAGLKEKVIEGEVKPSKPKEVRGAHSPTILNHPTRFQILSQETNPNGTIKVKLKKWIVTPEAPQGTWSKPKSSTLAPLHWTEEDVDYAGKITLMHGKFHKAEKRDDGTVTFLRHRAYRMVEEDLDHKSTKNGAIEWEITVTEKNEITSSYPTGN